MIAEMDAAVYEIESRVEATHWWFAGRRRLFSKEIAQQGIAHNACVLDIGTGTGSNLRMLQETGFRNVLGIDQSEDAIRFCTEKGFKVEKGDICSLPFPDLSIDLILATDIIEHVDEDDVALAEIARVLAPSGRALITVPAFQSLWGRQDDVAHHKRRYRRRELLEKLRGAQLSPMRVFYFNSILFGPIWLARQLMRIIGTKIESENELNPSWLNRLLTPVFAIDVAMAPSLRLPFGVSILVMAERSDQLLP